MFCVYTIDAPLRRKYLTLLTIVTSKKKHCKMSIFFIYEPLMNIQQIDPKIILTYLNKIFRTRFIQINNHDIFS